MIFVPRKEYLGYDVDTAIYIALALKRRWLLTADNRRRINECGLLPSDLAIGIHFGKAYINEDEEFNRFRPEGYAINLTKRIEGESRDGQFTHIYVSEAARGQLHLVTDEPTYSLDRPHTVRIKGITNEIRVYEVKHHFLPTDWAETDLTVQRTRASAFDPSAGDLELVERAYHANPTNLWLAEEYILVNILRSAFEEAQDVARRLRAIDLGDAGILTISGMIEGERVNYEEEQRLYNEAIKLDREYPEAHWYLGYSRSYQLYEELGGESGLDISFDSLSEKRRSIVEEILSNFRRATELSPRQSWIRYDLACELSRWGHRENAVDTLQHAVAHNPSIRHVISDEAYLRPILEDPRVTQLLKGL